MCEIKPKVVILTCPDLSRRTSTYCNSLGSMMQQIWTAHVLLTRTAGWSKVLRFSSTASSSVDKS